MNFYILTFDREPTKSYKEFHDDFVNHPGIEKWWHYIQSSYIVGSTTLNQNDISEHFAQTAKKMGIKSTHLVLNVNLSYRQGLLKKDAWAWLKKNSSKQFLFFKSATQAFTSLL